MNKILCSSGAIIGKPNGNDYRLLKEFVPRLECDGIELMVSSSWYRDLDDIISTINSYGISIPVIHSQKSLGESLCGMTTYYDGEFHDRVFSCEEDAECFKEGTKRFEKNVIMASRLGADRIVLHLWNGTVSDKNIEKNVERFAGWKEIAEREGIELLVENVICNKNDPLHNVALVAKAYDDAGFVYDTKMAEFHAQTMKLFDKEYEWIVAQGRIRHLHVNDYSGGYKDWGNMKVLPIGKGHVDFDAFFEKLGSYGYAGDYTIEATALSSEGKVDFASLNESFEKLRKLNRKYIETIDRLQNLSGGKRHEGNGYLVKSQ